MDAQYVFGAMSSPAALKSAVRRLSGALITSIVILVPAVVGFLFFGPVGAMAGGVIGSFIVAFDTARTREGDAQTDRISCQACGADNVASANYWQNCGVELEVPDGIETETARKKSNDGVHYCDKCGNTVPEESKSCPSCGRAFL